MTNLIMILIPLLIAVESGGDGRAVGDAGMAVGCLQIWTCTVQDCNRILRADVYTDADRWDRQASIGMCRVYLLHYGLHYERTQGQPATMEVLARIWNGGPRGWAKRSTTRYWAKVQAAHTTRGN